MIWWFRKRTPEWRRCIVIAHHLSDGGMTWTAGQVWHMRRTCGRLWGQPWADVPMSIARGGSDG